MKIPLRPSLMEVRRGKPQWIILHQTSEMYENPASKIDNNKFQLKGIASGVLEKKQADINYHYIIDKIDEDYQAIVCRPIVYLCDWPDISADINKRAIHIAFLGNYDFTIPTKRLYEVIAFRLLNPMLKMFKLDPARIKFHRDVSDNKELTCPGDFLDVEVVKSMVRRFVVK